MKPAAFLQLLLLSFRKRLYIAALCLCVQLLTLTAARSACLQNYDSAFGSCSAISVPVELRKAFHVCRQDIEIRLHGPGGCEPRNLRAVDVVPVSGISSLDSGIGDEDRVGRSRCGVNGEVLVSIGRGAVVEVLMD